LFEASVTGREEGRERMNGDCTGEGNGVGDAGLERDARARQESTRDAVGFVRDRAPFSSAFANVLRLKVQDEHFCVYDVDIAREIEEQDRLQPWRVRDRLKTVSVALVLCLNIGVDPPDVVKPDPCARLECWINPLETPPARALDRISKELQLNYERWQPRARYKMCTDPTVDDVKKLCVSLRKNAKEERVLFHYNGHGVPRPTANGEIWVFNKTYTQYIPLSIYDLQTWMGTPSIYVFDCSAAGLILTGFKQFCQQREDENFLWLQQQRNEAAALGKEVPPPPTRAPSPFRDCILLAACRSNELLPTNPDLPADLFTSCLTTPIKTALRWFAPRSFLQSITPDMLDRVCGRLNDRKTPLGELNWIFTAITDTIAWNVLPRPLFKRLFRQDLLVASLFRNFLLAERIMWTANCTPISEPALPPTHNHPLWQAWDYTVEQCLSQLPSMIAADEAARERARAVAESVNVHGNHARPDEKGGLNGGVAGAPFVPASGVAPSSAASALGAAAGARPADGTASNLTAFRAFVRPQDHAVESRVEFEYKNNAFFEDQMTAFEVWLAMGPQERSPPEQLPIVLQVLLSQAHRLRALKLLSRFLQMGPWAIDLALSVGIFPYVLKLLQSPSTELRQELVFIWGKILALDRSCEVDLVKDGGQVYFIEFLASANSPAVHLAMAGFVLSTVALDAPDKCLLNPTFVAACANRLEHSDSRVRRWSCLCLSRLVLSSYDALDRILETEGLIDTLMQMTLSDHAADVRAAACNFVGHIYSACERRLLLRNLMSSAQEANVEAARAGLSRDSEEQDVFRRTSYRVDFGSRPANGPLRESSQADQSAQSGEDAREQDERLVPYVSVSMQAMDVFAVVCEDDACALVRREVVFALSQSVEKRASDLAALLEARMAGASNARAPVQGVLCDPSSASAQLLLRSWALLNALALDAHPLLVLLSSNVVRLVNALLPMPMPDIAGTTAAGSLQQDGVHSISVREKASRMEPVSVVTAVHEMPHSLAVDAIARLIKTLSQSLNPASEVGSAEWNFNGGAERMAGRESHEVDGSGWKMTPAQVNFTFKLGSPEALALAARESPSLYEWSCNEILSLECSVSGGEDMDGAVYGFPDSAALDRILADCNREHVLQHKTIHGAGGTTRRELVSRDKQPQRDSIVLRPAQHKEEFSKRSQAFTEMASFELFRGGIWSMAFAPCEPLLVLGTSLGTVLMFDYEKWNKRDTVLGVARLDASKARGITALKAVGRPGQGTIFAVGAADGKVGLWRRISVTQHRGAFATDSRGLRASDMGAQAANRVPSQRDNFSLVSSFSCAMRAYNSDPAAPATSNSQGYGFFMSWQSLNDGLLTGGCEGALVRLWDMNAERCVWLGAAFSSTASVTAVCAASSLSREGLDAVSSDMHVHAMGASDGSVACLDTRVKDASSAVMCLRSHRAPVVAMSRSFAEGYSLLATGDTSGLVHMWDMRMMERGSVRTVQAHALGKLSALTIGHGNILDRDLLVTGSANRCIKALNLDGSLVRRTLFHEGFLSTRIAPVTALTSHPTRGIVAAGFADSVISFFRI